MRIASILTLSALATASASGAVLWQDAGPTSVTANGSGVSTSLSPGISRDNAATDTLFFRVTINPSTSTADENFFAAFQLYEGGNERLAIGNGWNPHAWSTFASDLNSSTPEPGQSYELVAPGVVKTIVYQVDYQAGGNDTVTIWLNPVNGTAGDQPASLTTHVSENASFDQIQLRIGNTDGLTWEFSNMAIATDFNDLVATPEPSVGLLGALAGLFLLRRRR